MVRFDYVGSNTLANNEIKEAIDYMNSSVLPIGFSACNESRGWFYENKEKYAGLILLVIAIIFVICSIHFNSLRYPLSIIFAIPIAFMGLFIAFGVSGITFDKGGFAAFVMLSGITVNAGIFLISSLLSIKQNKPTIHHYIKAFNKKVWPITLTIISSILGLVPFLFDGPSEVFWFCFALGTISGLIFSVIGLVFYLPIFALKKYSKK